MTRMAPASWLVVVAACLGCSRQDPPPPAAPPAASPAATGAGTAATPASPAPPAPAAAPVAALATADAETAGVRAEVTELRRTSGGTVSLKFAVINDSSEAVSFGYDYADPGGNSIIDYGSIGGTHLIDPVGKRKYFVARDSESRCVCSQKVADIPKGGRANLWAKFPAPPDDVQRISIVVPHFSPMDDVPLSR